MKICLQAGHEGMTSGSIGAPGEQELNIRIRDRLSQILISKGFQLFLVDANPPDSQISQDFDLFLALHGDANIYGTGGGCVGSADPSVDSVPQESARIRDCIREEYFKHSGIAEHEERVNRNITEYYMWMRLSANTPCVLIEMGVVQDAHDKVILADQNIVPSAIARGICKAFNVPYDPIVPPSTQEDPLPDSQKTDLALLNQYKSALQSIKQIVYGRNFSFYKKEVSAIKNILTQAGI